MLTRLFKAAGGLVLLAIAVSLVLGALREQRYRSSMPLGEVIGPAEDTRMADAVAMALRMINATRDGLIAEGVSGSDYPTGEEGAATAGGEPVVYRRDVHIKSHGCVKAELVVPELPEEYRHGVFREPGRHAAWVRFSNGDYRLHPDSVRDARGMAIKLLDVPGEKLLPSQETATTQDFVMMNSPNYFIRDLDDYVELTKYLAVGDNFGYFLNDWSWNPFSWRWRELRLVAGTKKPPPESPLLAQYFSASAYKLGPENNIKFSARPSQCPGATSPRRRSWSSGKGDYDFLRERMVQQLADSPACFDFMVQLQVPGKPMPVEDATIVWKESDSPFVPVARVEIPAQEFDMPAQNAFCEDLSFNPWHSLPAHRPIGVFNRVRKALYSEVAKYRWAANRSQYQDQPSITLEPEQPPEPDGLCSPTEGDCDS
jgi:catalase